MFYVIPSGLKSLSRAVAVGALATQVLAADPPKDPAVKKSDAGICHDVSSASFNNTKKFTPFSSLEECVKSGGKLPAGKTLPVVEIVEKI